jgi:hypothetical protein
MTGQRLIAWIAAVIVAWNGYRACADASQVSADRWTWAEGLVWSAGIVMLLAALAAAVLLALSSRGSSK